MSAPAVLTALKLLGIAKCITATGEGSGHASQLFRFRSQAAILSADPTLN